MLTLEEKKQKKNEYNKQHSEHIKEYQKQYRKDHLEESKKYRKQYNKAYSEEIKKERKQYYKDNSEKIDKCHRQWRKLNPEKVKKIRVRSYKKNNEYNRRWQKENPEKCRAKYHKRRAKKVGNGGSFTIGEWNSLKKQYEYICPMCNRKEPEIKLTVDHIIPITRGGSSYIENIQPLCRNCNDKKYIKIFRITPNGDLMLF